MKTNHLPQTENVKLLATSIVKLAIDDLKTRYEKIYLAQRKNRKCAGGQWLLSDSQVKEIYSMISDGKINKSVVIGNGEIYETFETLWNFFESPLCENICMELLGMSGVSVRNKVIERVEAKYC